MLFPDLVTEMQPCIAEVYADGTGKVTVNKGGPDEEILYFEFKSGGKIIMTDESTPPESVEGTYSYKNNKITVIADMYTDDDPDPIKVKLICERV